MLIIEKDFLLLLLAAITELKPKNPAWFRNRRIVRGRGKLFPQDNIEILRDMKSSFFEIYLSFNFSGSKAITRHSARIRVGSSSGTPSNVLSVNARGSSVQPKIIRSAF